MLHLSAAGAFSSCALQGSALLFWAFVLPALLSTVSNAAGHPDGSLCACSMATFQQHSCSLRAACSTSACVGPAGPCSQQMHPACRPPCSSNRALSHCRAGSIVHDLKSDVSVACNASPGAASDGHVSYSSSMHLCRPAWAFCPAPGGLPGFASRSWLRRTDNALLGQASRWAVAMLLQLWCFQQAVSVSFICHFWQHSAQAACDAACLRCLYMSAFSKSFLKFSTDELCLRGPVMSVNLPLGRHAWPFRVKR